MSRLALSIGPPVDESGESGLTQMFAVRGELDIASGSVLEHALIDELAAIPDEIVLGLSDLAFIDIVGLRALERVRADLAAHGCRLTLRSVPPQAARLLELVARATGAKPTDRVNHSASRRRTHSSSRIGIATMRPRKPRTSPTATTSKAITAGYRWTSRDITRGSITLAST